MKNNICLFLLSLETLFVLSRCSEDNNAAIIYFPDAATAVKVNFTMSNEPYVRTFQVTIMAESYPAPKTTGLTNDVVVRLTADPAKVSEYNADKGTSYEVLPEGSYLVASEAFIKAGNYLSEPVSLLIDAKDKITPFTNYLLPISIQTIKGASPDNVYQTLYFLIYAEMDAGDAVFLSRAGWTYAASSEELVGEGDNNGHVEHAFDGKNNTFWHTKWKDGTDNPPHIVTVDMKTEHDLFGFSYSTRYDFNQNANGPRVCKIEISLDGQEWTEAGYYEDLPSTGKTEVRKFFPVMPQKARYFKMTVEQVNGGASMAIAEINVF